MVNRAIICDVAAHRWESSSELIAQKSPAMGYFALHSS
jgi:hypothetical protein